METHRTTKCRQTVATRVFLATLQILFSNNDSTISNFKDMETED